MKFWRNFVIFIVAIISFILGFSRYFAVRNNFVHSINSRISQNTNQYSLEKYMLENKVIETIKNSKEITNDVIIECLQSIDHYTENSSESFALYDEDYKNIYSNQEDFGNIKSILYKEYDNYTIEIINNKHYMLFSSHWSINHKILYVVNGYNVEDLYEERNRQVRDLVMRDVVIVAISSMVIYIFFFLINNHIKKINLQAKQKDDFINGFMHELKTPMTAIMGYSDMLRLKKCDEEVSKKALGYIYSESKRLEKLSHKLLSLMSLSNEKIELQTLEIKEFTQKLISNILIENKMELEMEDAYVLADSELLEVIIRNLIENANKAEPKDNKILIRGEKLKNKKYRIFVIDQGKGIPKEHVARVTEDFYMVDKSRSRENGGSRNRAFLSY